MSDRRTSFVDRQRRLGGLVPMWPSELADDSIAGRLHVCKLLRAAIRAERRRGRSGHRGYRLLRHARLLRAYRDELRELRALLDRRRFDVERALSGIRVLH